MNDREVSQDKIKLRQRMLRLRAALDEKERFEQSQRICQMVWQYVIEPRLNSTVSLSVLGYMPFQNEVDIKPILRRCIESGIKVWLPKVSVQERRMEFFQTTGLTQEDVHIGAYGIMEPKPEASRKWQASTIDSGQARTDIMLVPGIAFDRFMGRLGYGGGYYDRFLGKLKYTGAALPVLIAPAYSFQIVSRIPMEPFDCPLDGIVTGHDFYSVKDS